MYLEPGRQGRSPLSPETRPPVPDRVGVAKVADGKSLFFLSVRFAHPTLPGSTDCRYYRPHGTIAYGANLFDPDLTFVELMRSIHGVDEKISLTSLGTSLQFFALTLAYHSGL